MPPRKNLEDDLRELQRERAEREERGVLPRAIERHHRFRFGHDPNDDDATPASGWEYATVVPGPRQPLGPPILGQGGPDSGLNCQVGGCKHRLRIIDEFGPGEILRYIANGEEQVSVVRGDVKICILACPNRHVTQMRSDCLPRSTNLLLP